MGIVEQQITQPKLLLRSVRQAVQRFFPQRATLRVLRVEDAEEFQHGEPRRLLVVESMSPNRFVDPHPGAGAVVLRGWPRQDFHGLDPHYDAALSRPAVAAEFDEAQHQLAVRRSIVLVDLATAFGRAEELGLESQQVFVTLE